MNQRCICLCNRKRGEGARFAMVLVPDLAPQLAAELAALLAKEIAEQFFSALGHRPTFLFTSSDEMYSSAISFRSRSCSPTEKEDELNEVCID